MNNIEFSITSNKANTKFKIAWTIKLGDYAQTKIMAREFPTQEAAQEYLNKNEEQLAEMIRQRISKMVISIPEPKEEETKEEVETEVTQTEEVPQNDDEAVIDEAAESLPEIEVEIEETQTEENEEIETQEETEETETTTALVPIDEASLVPYEEEVVARTPNRKVKIASRIISGILAVVLLIGLHHIIRRIKNDNETLAPAPGITDTNTPDTNAPETVEETLTTENFENLVAQVAKNYQDKDVNVSTEDIAKFVSIINIDKLTKENPELAQELFGEKTKEQYIQEAARVIGETVMYNAKVFEETKNTEGFIRISDAVYGDSKEQMITIESYVDEIAKVYYAQEQVNPLATDLIKRLVTGDLQNLDNGTQFGMQVSIELIRSYIAKDVLTDVNRDVLTDITRLDVSGIMETYDNVNGLSGNTKTRN